MSTASFRPDIEGLRAVAVLLVLVFHAGLPVPAGYVGVDVFFVISGFLITSLIVREAETSGSVSLWTFYARRAKRLLPAASLVLVVTSLLVWLIAPSADRPAFGFDVAAAAGYVANWRFALRSVDYLAEDVGRSPVLHFWSLAVEEQFYFLWPLILVAGVVLARRLKWPLRVTLSLLLATLVLGPSLVWSIMTSQSNQAQAFFVTSTRLWELAIGAEVALALPLLRRLPQRVGGMASLLGMVLIGASAFAFDTRTSWPGYWACLPTFGTALAILGGSLEQKSITARTLSTRPMVFIGGLSYSIYLWHWPLVVVGQDWLELTGRGWGTLIVLGSVVPALLSYRFVETPLRFARALTTRPRYALSIGANFSLISLASGLAISALDSASNPQESNVDGVQLGVKDGRVIATPPKRGAGALGRNPMGSSAGVPKKKYDVIIPPPKLAPKDLPSAYADDCQLAFDEVDIRWCEAGDPNGKKTLAMVGDSKILQYFDALNAVSEAASVKLITATKSSCPFSEATVVYDDKPYQACNTVNDEVMKQLEAKPPYAIITSQAALTGIRIGHGDTPTEQTMIEGLAAIWSRVRALGTEVIVVLDSPHPSTKPRVYDCLAKQGNNGEKCAFSRETAVKRSAAAVQREAAKRVPGVHVIDLTNYICPAARCAPVIGDVLVYRQGSHITNTYARSLAPVLASELHGVLGSD